MKFIRPQKPDSAGRPFIFHISQREKVVLLATLKLYPLLDASYHQLSRNPKTTGQAEQQWLEEAMEQQRQDHKKRLGQLFNNDRRFFKEGKGDLLFTLTGEQMEWMLRVLNEIRVGSWVRLGRPGNGHGAPAQSDQRKGPLPGLHGIERLFSVGLAGGAFLRIFPHSRFFVSIIIVTGPSLVSATFMSAPNSPFESGGPNLPPA